MDDKKIMALMKKDINRGADELMNKYSGFVYSIISMRLSKHCDTMEIEDCTAETFHKFIFSALSFDPERSSLRSYLGIIARNNAIDYLRRKKTVISIDDNESLLDIASNDDTEKEAIDRLTFSELMDEINALGMPDSFILIRKYYFGQSSKEIGKELDMLPGTVDVRAGRAIEKIRKKRRI